MGKRECTHLRKSGADFIAAHGDSIHQHGSDAMHCEHPYAGQYELPLDLALGVQMLKSKKNGINQWRSRQLKGLRSLQKEAEILDKTVRDRSMLET